MSETFDGDNLPIEWKGSSRKAVNLIIVSAKGKGVKPLFANRPKTFCVVKVLGKPDKLRTHSVHNTWFPAWNFSGTLPFSEGDELDIEVWEYFEVDSGHRVTGKAIVPSWDVAPGELKVPVREDGMTRGELIIRVFSAPGKPSHDLVAIVRSGRGFRRYDSRSTSSNPYVVCKVHEKTGAFVRIPPAYDGSLKDPVWDQVVILSDYHRGDSLQFDVFLDNRLYGKAVMGPWLVATKRKHQMPVMDDLERRGELVVEIVELPELHVATEPASLELDRLSNKSADHRDLQASRPQTPTRSCGWSSPGGVSQPESRPPWGDMAGVSDGNGSTSPRSIRSRPPRQDQEARERRQRVEERLRKLENEGKFGPIAGSTGRPALGKQEVPEVPLKHFGRPEPFKEEVWEAPLKLFGPLPHRAASSKPLGRSQGGLTASAGSTAMGDRLPASPASRRSRSYNGARPEAARRKPSPPPAAEEASEDDESPLKVFGCLPNAVDVLDSTGYASTDPGLVSPRWPAGFNPDDGWGRSREELMMATSPQLHLQPSHHAQWYPSPVGPPYQEQAFGAANFGYPAETSWHQAEIPQPYPVGELDSRFLPGSRFPTRRRPFGSLPKAEEDWPSQRKVFGSLKRAEEALTLMRLGQPVSQNPDLVFAV